MCVCVCVCVLCVSVLCVCVCCVCVCVRVCVHVRVCVRVCVVRECVVCVCVLCVCVCVCVCVLCVCVRVCVWCVTFYHVSYIYFLSFDFSLTEMETEKSFSPQLSLKAWTVSKKRSNESCIRRASKLIVSSSCNAHKCIICVYVPEYWCEGIVVAVQSVCMHVQKPVACTLICFVRVLTTSSKQMCIFG